MINKFFLSILSLLAGISVMFAATYPQQLQWNGKESVAFGSSYVDVISLENAIYFAKVPYAQVEIPEQLGVSQKFEIANVLLSDLSDFEKENLSQSSVQPQESVSLMTQRLDGKYVLRFLPFVKENGIVKKIISFDVVETVTPQSALLQSVQGVSAAANSVMKQGEWVKIRVPESGVYKLTYEDVVNAGVNPDDLHIYGYGGAMQNEDISKSHYDDLPQCPYAMFAGEDGVFNRGDYVLFYAQGPITWEYSSLTKEFLRTRNPYSDYGYYFLASGTGESPKTIQMSPAVVVPDGEFSVLYKSFVDHYLYETERVNLAESGREYYGEELSQSSPVLYPTFNVPNIDVMANMVLRVNTAVNSSSNDGKRSSIEVRVGKDGDGVGGNSPYVFNATNVSSGDYYTKGVETGGIFYGRYPYMKVPVTVKFNAVNATAKAWVNYVTLTATRDLTMDGSQMAFRTPFFAGGYASFSIAGSADGNIVWDVSELTDVKQMSTTFLDGNLRFVSHNVDGKIQEFVAVNPNGKFNKPEIVGKVENQNLHSLENPTLVIIANEEYIDAANRVAEAHRSEENMKVTVATIEQVYNEFSSGTPDASAYRWFMKMFYDRYKNAQSATEPKYLMLYGDGTFDNRQVLKDGCNKVLAYESYASLSETESYLVEDYFGFMDDIGSGDMWASISTVDVSVGRVPVHTKSDADAVADKLVRYISNKSLGKWKNQLLFLGDDGGSGDGIRHVKQCDSVANRVISKYPDFQVTKLYLDAFSQQTSASGEAYPEAKEKFWKMIKSGVLYMNYVGHGGVDALTNEKIVTNAELLELYNENQAFWTTSTCNFSRYDSPTVSAGENVLYNKNGGGIGLFSTVRTVYSDPNYALNREFVVPMFDYDENGEQYRVGDMLKYAKNNCTSKMYDNKLSFVLLGDPALRLVMPTYEVCTNSVNGKIVKEASVGALDRVDITGSVTNKGEVMTDFDGVVYVSIFDKEKSIKTMDNHKEGVYTYIDRSCIFSGKAQVVKGVFSISLMLPKDIDYSVGDGKIIYYAADEEHGYEANGYDLLTIGGFAEGSFEDEEGPQVDLYLNTTNFRSGDTMAKNPLLIAYLDDENGINISGAGIGHDIAISIDNGEWVVLNDYYESDMGTFRSGMVKYTLPELEEGVHTLSFRAWDLLNNSTLKTIEFKISDNSAIDVAEVFCYPNPVKDHVVFAFRHNRPEDVIGVTLHILDMTGRQVLDYKTELYSEFNADGNLTTIVDWDLNTNSGSALADGVYLYSVEFDCKTGKEVTKTKKMIVAK